MTVIVEPDTLGGWLALVGVVAGVLLTGAVTWIQQRWSDRKNRGHEVSQAAADLLASANGLQMMMSGFVVSSDAPEAARHWIPTITTMLERVEKANLTITRLSRQQPLVGAANELAEAARTLARSYGESSDDAVLTSKIAAFSAKAQGS